MIAVEQPPVVDPARAPRGPVDAPPSRAGWSSRLSAVLLVCCIVSSLGGGGLVDLGSAYSLQGRAEALGVRWIWMVDNGIPESDLAPLRREWTASQAARLLGAGAAFWLPGGAATVTRWERSSDALWASDLNRYRSDAQTAEQALHDALAPETHAQRRTRLEALTLATTPRDFSSLRDEWLAEARLVPVDRRIASEVEQVG